MDRTLGIAALFVTTVACTSNAKPGELQDAELDGLPSLHRVGDLYLAGQPSEDALAELARRGTTLVIDLRRPGELTSFDEGAVVRALGMRYENLPVGSPADLTGELFDEARSLLDGSTDEPVLLHCASANRVGAVWVAFRVLDQGVEWDVALEEAHRIGLRSQGLEARAREYVMGGRVRPLGRDQGRDP